jgi:uncharacterized protein involved in exopolysaccharide biosynthesis
MSEQQEPNRFQHNRSVNPSEDEISLVDLAIALAKHKKLIVFFPIATAIIVGIYTLFIPDTFLSTAKILPVGGSIPKETILSLLQSEAMSDNMINRFKLMDVYHAQNIAQARRRFATASTASVDKQGLIDITVEDGNPKRAALIANAQVEELKGLVLGYGLTEASSRRLLLEKQLVDVRQAVMQSEQDVVRERTQVGALTLDANLNSFVRSLSALKAKIALKELELYTPGFDPVRNPNYIRSLQEYSALWTDFENMDSDPVLKRKLSGNEIEYLQKITDLEYNQTRYDQLLKQRDKAKFEEIREKPMIQVLNNAEIPEQKSKPKRSRMVLVSACVSGFFAILFAFAYEAVRHMMESSENDANYKLLLNLLRWK